MFLIFISFKPYLVTMFLEISSHTSLIHFAMTKAEELLILPVSSKSFLASQA